REEADRKLSGHSDRISFKEMSFILVVGLSGLLFLPLGVACACLLVLLVLYWLLSRYWLKRIGGYTGDCLGGAQQLAEVSVYLVLSAALV
ncbi:MAG: adenosylcobinamide-GDP ribazoletransferase, partial [Oceanospirillum sp.]|nr:adenosylcobinamide-GDP ribazoletransferase [Oceanospirillum sp.]